MACLRKFFEHRGFECTPVALYNIFFILIKWVGGELGVTATREFSFVKSYLNFFTTVCGLINFGWLLILVASFAVR